MTDIRLRLEGTTPLVHDKFGPSPDEGTDPRQAAMTRAHHLPGIGFHLRAEHLLSCWNLGKRLLAKGTRWAPQDGVPHEDRRRGRKGYDPNRILAQALFLKSVVYPIGTERFRVLLAEGWHTPMTPRPLFDTWSLSVDLTFDERMLTEKTLRDIVTFGGTTVGLGFMRPALGGPYGKYAVAEWT